MIRLKEEWHGSFWPDDEIHALSSSLTGELGVASNRDCPELRVPLLMLLDIALHNADAETMVLGQSG